MAKDYALQHVNGKETCFGKLFQKKTKLDYTVLYMFN